MLVELAKPVTFVLCIVSLYALFHTAFLIPAVTLRQRMEDSLLLLALAAIVSLISGLVFREAEPKRDGGGARLLSTLPVRMFCWAASGMIVLFIAARYLEAHCVFYRDVRF